MARKASADAVGKDIQRRIRKKCSADENIRVVLEGLLGGSSIAELWRREGDPEQPLLLLE